MPQFETATFLSQFFWLITCFISLWVFMALFITPKIEDVLEQRRLKIDNYIQKAEVVNKEALQSLEKYEKAIAHAKENAETRRTDSQKALAHFMAEQRAELEAELARKIAQNEANVEKIRLDTQQRINEISVMLAQDILQKAGIDAQKAELEKLVKSEG